MPSYILKKQIIGIYEVLSVLPYDGYYKSAILTLKFGKRKQYAYQLAKLMTEKLKNEIDPTSFDVISFVPLHGQTQKERGFNQSELLAYYMGAALNLPVKPLLKKVRKNKPQHSLSASERQKNVEGVYRCVDKKLVKGKRIIFTDDIVTTGLTLSECAKVLTKNGAEDIYFITFAASQPKTT